MMRRVCTLIAFLFLILGVISMVTPIPGGVIFLAIGLTMLISVSPPARYCIQWMRARFNLFNKSFGFIERKVEKRFEKMGATLKLTNPDGLDASASHDDFVEQQIEKDNQTSE